MGSLFSPKVETTPPPPPPTYVNVRDEIGGTQSNYVTNPDGTKTLVTTALPLSPEEQAYKDKLDQVARDSLDYVTKLSTSYDVADIPGLQQYLDDYKATQIDALDTAAADGAEQQERQLARYGQADSTAAVKGRGQRDYNYGQNRKQIDQNLSTIAQEARQNAIGNATGLFGLATGRQDAALTALSSSLARGQNFQLADAGNQMAYNNTVYNAALQNNALKSQASAAGLGTLTSLGALATYGVGKMGGFSALGKKLGWA